MEALGKKLRRESGLLESNTREFQRAIKEAQPELIAFKASIDDISKASGSRQFWIFRYRERKNSYTFKIGTAFGVQSDTMVNVVSEARLRWVQ